MRFFKNKHFKGVAAVIIITVILAIISCFKSNFVVNTLNTLSTPVQSVFAAMIRPISQHFTMLNEMEGYKSENERLIKEITKLKIENRDTKSYVEENGLKMNSDEDGLKTVIEEVLAKNPQSVEDFKNGKDKAMGFLVGQTMKATGGKANPGVINKILKELLSK